MLLSTLILFLLTMHPFSYEGLWWGWWLNYWTVWSHENTMNKIPGHQTDALNLAANASRYMGNDKSAMLLWRGFKMFPPERLMNRFLIGFCAEQVMGFWTTNGFWWHIQIIKCDSKLLKESQHKFKFRTSDGRLDKWYLLISKTVKTIKYIFLHFLTVIRCSIANIWVFLCFIYFLTTPFSDFPQIKKTTCHKSFLNLIAFNLVLSCRRLCTKGKTNQKRSELAPLDGFIFWWMDFW